MPNTLSELTFGWLFLLFSSILSLSTYALNMHDQPVDMDASAVNEVVK